MSLMRINAERSKKISLKDHVTNEDKRRKIQAVIGKYDELLGQETETT